jgi:hypothetical protein
VNRSRRLLYILMLAILAGGLVLAACGGDDDNNNTPPYIRPSIQPQANTTVLPGCEAYELGDWYEVAETQIKSFSQESLNALNLAPDDTGDIRNRLIDLRNRIGQQNPPECALHAHNEILARTDAIIAAFDAYSREEISQEELRQQVEALNAEIGSEVTALLTGTQTRLEEQFKYQRETQAVATPTPVGD